MFLAQYPVLSAEIHRALSASECAALAGAVHKLGSSVGQVEAIRALRIARQVEEFAESCDLANVPASVAALEAEVELVKFALVEQGLGLPASAELPRLSG